MSYQGGVEVNDRLLTSPSALPSCPSLVELDLRWCSLDDKAAKKLMRKVPFTQLKELYLGNNLLTDGKSANTSDGKTR